MSLSVSYYFYANFYLQLVTKFCYCCLRQQRPRYFSNVRLKSFETMQCYAVFDTGLRITYFYNLAILCNMRDIIDTDYYYYCFCQNLNLAGLICVCQVRLLELDFHRLHSQPTVSGVGKIKKDFT